MKKVPEERETTTTTTTSIVRAPIPNISAD